MLNLIVRAGLNNRLVVLGAAALLVVAGLLALLTLPVDVFPDLNKPTVIIMTEVEGLAPPEVEQLVGYPIETALNGIPGVTRVRSVAGIGLSIDRAPAKQDPAFVFRDAARDDLRILVVDRPAARTNVAGQVVPGRDGERDRLATVGAEVHEQGGY